MGPELEPELEPEQSQSRYKTTLVIATLDSQLLEQDPHQPDADLQLNFGNKYPELVKRNIVLATRHASPFCLPLLTPRGTHQALL